MYMAHERRAYILRLLQQRRRIRSAALARELGVTDETIRTDLVLLQQQGLLRRVHGGAEFILPSREQNQSSSQRPDCLMADLILPYLRAEALIYADATGFTLSLLSRLGDFPCTFITNSPKIINAFAPAAIPQQVLCPGGMLDKESRLLDSPAARAELARLKPDFAILAPPSVRPGEIAYRTRVQAEWAATALRCAKWSILAAPFAVYGEPAPHSVPCRPDLLITEDNYPEEWEEQRKETIPHPSTDFLMNENGFDY